MSDTESTEPVTRAISAAGSADPSGAANQRRARAYNERLVLSLVRRNDGLSKAGIAKRSGLSAQAVSVIMRSLESDDLLLRGEPVRGKVGQPSIPMSVNPEGAYSIGLKVGRRSADIVLLDFAGNQKLAKQVRYDYPKPTSVLAFVKRTVKEINRRLSTAQQNRIAGIGVSMPFELWNWAEQIDAPAKDMLAWKTFDFQQKFERFCDYPVFVENDATAACGAELVFGHGAELSDFVYFFIGTFVGGGVVLNHAVFRGRTGNAGAIGSMPVVTKDGKPTQLIDHASVLALENRLRSDNKDPSVLWLSPTDWSSIGEQLDDWIETTAQYIAMAIASSCAVIDFAAAVIDGGIPTGVRKRLVLATERNLKQLDLTGINEPVLYEGQIGSGARAIGAACLPLFSRYLLDQNVLFGAPT